MSAFSGKHRRRILCVLGWLASEAYYQMGKETVLNLGGKRWRFVQLASAAYYQMGR